MRHRHTAAETTTARRRLPAGLFLYACTMILTAAGAAIAVKRTGDRTVYEWAYPPAALAPNASSRLSLFLLDTDATPGAEKPYSRLGGISLGGQRKRRCASDEVAPVHADRMIGAIRKTVPAAGIFVAVSATTRCAAHSR